MRPSDETAMSVLNLDPNVLYVTQGKKKRKEIGGVLFNYLESNLCYGRWEAVDLFATSQDSSVKFYGSRY